MCDNENVPIKEIIRILKSMGYRTRGNKSIFLKPVGVGSFVYVLSQETLHYRFISPEDKKCHTWRSTKIKFTEKFKTDLVVAENYDFKCFNFTYDDDTMDLSFESIKD